MNSEGFMRIANEAFAPFLTQLDFTVSGSHASGRCYLVEFTGTSHIVSVSFEPGDDALFVLVFMLDPSSGMRSDIDDAAKTPRLEDLSRRYMSSIGSQDRAENEAAFESVATHDREERMLLRAAKDLRLVLRRHIDS